VNRDHRLRDPQNQVGRVSIDIPPAAMSAAGHLKCPAHTCAHALTC
jgi:hypothetical protein